MRANEAFVSPLPPRCGPLAPAASVRVRADDRAVPRGAMLRLAVAAGAAADARTGLVDVELLCDGPPRPIGALWDGDRLFVRAHLDTVTAQRAADLAAAIADADAPFDGSPPTLSTAGVERKPARVVLLHNPFRDPDRPGDERPDMAVGTFQLTSSLHCNGVPFRLVEGAYHPVEGFDRLDELGQALEPGSLLGLTLLEGCLGAVRALTDRLGPGPTVVAGGPMATWTPMHALAHLPGVHAVVRGDGEAILPRLAALLDGEPDAAAQEEILGLDGLVYLCGGLLLAGHPGRTNRIEVDDTPMEFDLLEARHLSRGLSLETGRGCAHGCTFCSTPGRGAHRGRSAAVVGRHLQRYRERLTALFGTDVPAIARRVQICDDDFACDPRRAAEVLTVVGDSGLQLAAFQASVRDFLDRGSGDLRTDLLDALRPALFQDGDRHAALTAGAARGQLPADVGPSVHLGVESFADPDLRRLGKGYSAAQASAVIDALDRRRIVHDAYLILGNRGTTPDDLVDTLLALARLKLEHPHTFFLRTPCVPFVVPTAPTAAYELARRRGARLELERAWQLDGYPELDYPVVARELPDDPDVRAACGEWEAIVEPDAAYAAPLRNLGRWLYGRLPGIEEPRRRVRVRRAIRRLDGARRRLVYRGLARARRREVGERIADRYWRAADGLGPAGTVAAEARNAMEVGDPRLVVIPTRDCSMRCDYCPADKRSGQEMSESTLSEAVELLLSADAPRMILQFFGGEALLRRDLVLDGMDRAVERAASVGKQIGFIVSTNGVSLDPELIDRLASLPVKVEISLDGDRSVQNLHRRPRDPALDSYEAVSRNAPRLIASGIPLEVIMVVTPDTVGSLCDSFAHVASLGFRRIQVNHGLAMTWDRERKETFAAQLHAIEQRFFAESLESSELEWIDLRSFRDPMLLNGEVTVDHDGTVYFGNGFLIRTAEPAAFRAGHLDDLASFDSYVLRRPENEYLVSHTYPRDVAQNNIEVGRIYGSFVRHMRDRFPELSEVEPTRTPAPGGGERTP